MQPTLSFFQQQFNRLNSYICLKFTIMQTILILHNIIRWAILIFGIYTVFNAVTGLMSKREFNSTDNKSSLFFMIFCDIQLLLGIILLYTKNYFSKMSAMGELMKNTSDRFFVVEHGFMMILAWILVHVGRTAVKKAAPESKHKKMLIFFGIALLLILISIPWSFRAEIARPNFPWFN